MHLFEFAFEEENDDFLRRFSPIEQRGWEMINKN